MAFESGRRRGHIGCSALDLSFTPDHYREYACEDEMTYENEMTAVRHSLMLYVWGGLCSPSRHRPSPLLPLPAHGHMHNTNIQYTLIAYSCVQTCRNSPPDARAPTSLSMNSMRVTGTRDFDRRRNTSTHPRKIFSSTRPLSHFSFCSLFS